MNGPFAKPVSGDRRAGDDREVFAAPRPVRMEARVEDRLPATGRFKRRIPLPVGVTGRRLVRLSDLAARRIGGDVGRRRRRSKGLRGRRQNEQRR